MTYDDQTADNSDKRMWSTGDHEADQDTDGAPATIDGTAHESRSATWPLKTVIVASVAAVALGAGGGAALAVVAANADSSGGGPGGFGGGPGGSMQQQSPFGGTTQQQSPFGGKNSLPQGQRPGQQSQSGQQSPGGAPTVPGQLQPATKDDSTT